MDQYIGTLLDNRYEILEVIGTGGMAVVYKARCNRLNRLVAIKVLKQELSQDEEFRRRFHAESQAVAMLSHPNIASVYDVSHSNNLDYIVMELIEGITLKQYLEQKGKLNWREALHFSTQIAKALEHAHSRGIIHRDIKPHNIMILKDGSVKVADFGIARISSAQNTLTREALGSVHYISPEQAKGGHVDYRSDLYSLGVVMYEMLTGRPPFDGDTPVAVAIQHINAKPVMPCELNPEIPEGLEQITMHAMAADISKRYPSASRMLADLEIFRKNPNVVFDFTDDQDAFDVERLINDPEYLPTSLPRRERKQPTRVSIPQRRQQPAQQQESTSGKRGSNIALTAGIVCIVLAILGIGYFLYSYFFSDLFTRTEEVEVPQLVGKYFENFDQTQYPELKFEVTDHRASDAYESGYVIEQSTDAGTMVKAGSTIELTLSTGIESNTMPNLVNLPLENAQSYLTSLPITLDISVEYQQSDVYTDGYVIRTVPERDEPLTDGQSVTLVVSTGIPIELVKVPSLIGSDVDEALDAIEAEGLSKGMVKYVDSDLPEGTVTFQSIDAGEEVKAGTVINLQASKGPEEAQEPLIRTLSQDASVEVGDSLTLQVKAEVSDDGELTYAWYVSESGNVADAELVSRSGKDNTTCKIDTSKEGTWYYFCKIVNTLGESHTSVNTQMIRVEVTQKQEPVITEIAVRMPSMSGIYEVSVKVGGELQSGPYTVDMAEEPSRSIRIQVAGNGVQSVDVYLDGVLYDTQEIDFDSLAG